MARDLDQIFSGIGTRLLEERDDHLVDRVTLRIQQIGQVRVPRTPLDRGQELRGDGAHRVTGEAHHTKSGTSGRSGHRNDGVGEQLPASAGRTAAIAPWWATVPTGAAITIAAATAAAHRLIRL